MQNHTCNIATVQATLKHAVEALMLEDNVAALGLQPAVGRLANALVAVLGPELTLGSPAYCSCRALIREMQVNDPATKHLQHVLPGCWGML